MKYRFLIIAMACFALIFINCGKQEPLSPDIEVLSEENSLSKKPSEKFTLWEGVETTCELAEGQSWISDGILHVRDNILTDIIESDEPRVAGINTVVSNYNLNLKTGEGTLSTKWTLVPYTYEGRGAWEGSIAGRFTNGLWSGKGVGQGTGDLKGLTITVELVQRGIHDSPCNDAIYQFDDCGYIIEKK